MKYCQNSRNVRVFISSTFNDMQAERDYLVNNIFPKLRLEAQQRNVTVNELDLRWGITDAAKVIPICLEEIDNSRPFFIGIIGDRYGWCPSEEELMQNKDLAERFGWIRDDLKAGLSITEIEMQYGVLRSNANVNAFFYLKKGACKVDKAVENSDKLQLLKEKIVKNSRYPVSEYSSPEDLGTQVEAAFMKMLKREFPIGKQQNGFEKFRSMQEFHLNELTDTYIPNDHTLKVVDEFLNSHDSFLAITGETGIGKSALLAYIYQRNNHNKTTQYIYYCVGLNSQVERPNRVLDYIAQSLLSVQSKKKRTKEGYNNIGDLQNIITDAGKSIVILLDEINNLPAKDQFLGFLTELPKDVKVIFSMKDDDNLSATFTHRNYTIHQMGEMCQAARSVYISNYLAKFGKELTTDQSERIAADESCGNPQLLKSFLDELLCFGIYERLDEHINYYLGTHKDRAEFYSCILRRYENSYGIDLTEKALALIAISSDYLSENMIFHMLNVSKMEWTQFYCVIHKYLKTSDGGFSLLESPFKEAVCKRYLEHGKELQYRNQIISLLEPLFDPAKLTPAKMFSELAHQYYNTGNYDKLFECISTINAFEAIEEMKLLKYWETLLGKDPEKYTLSVYLNSSYWLSSTEEIFASFCEEDDITDRRKVEKVKCFEKIGDFIRENALNNFPLMADLYAKALEATPDRLSLASKLAYAYINTQEYKKAIGTINKGLSVDSQSDDKDLAESYGLLSLSYKAIGDKENAGISEQKKAQIENAGGFQLISKSAYDTVEECREAIATIIKQDGKTNSELVRLYNRLAELHSNDNEYKKAIEASREAIFIGENIGRRKCYMYLFNAYFDIVLRLQHIGEYEESVKYIDLMAEIEHEFGRIPEYSSFLKSNYYSYTGDYVNAIKYANENLTLCLDKYGKQSNQTASSLGRLAKAYHDDCQYSEALETYQQEIDVLLSLPQCKLDDLAMPHHLMFLIYNKQKQSDKAWQQLQAEADILIQISPDHRSLTACYLQMGKLAEESDQMWAFYEKAVKIATENQRDEDICHCLAAIADYCCDIEDYEQAIINYKQSIDIQLRLFKQNEDSMNYAYKVVLLEGIAVECNMLLVLLIYQSPNENNIKEAVSYGETVVNIADGIIDDLNSNLLDINEILKDVKG